MAVLLLHPSASHWHASGCKLVGEVCTSHKLDKGLAAVRGARHALSPERAAAAGYPEDRKRLHPNLRQPQALKEKHGEVLCNDREAS